MKIDVYSSEKWERVNQHFGANARVYRGMAEAVYELTVGTALFLRHKRSVCFIQGVSPDFQVALPFFYKETYQIHLPKISQINSANEFVEQLPKDCVFVAMVEDHPVTAEIYPIVDEIDALLSQKRILFLRISHSLFWHREIQLNPYTARLCSIDREYSVTFFGEKFKIPPLFSPFSNYDESVFIQIYKKQKENIFASEKHIVDFESEMNHIGAKSFFANQLQSIQDTVVGSEGQQIQQEHKNKTRLFDRSVIEFSGVHGELLMSRLKETFENVETANQCRWQTTNLFDQWWENSPSPDVLRGLVVFSARYVSDQANWDKIKSAYQDLLREQKW